MQLDQEYTVSCIIEEHYPREHQDHLRQHVNREAALKLWGVLTQGPARTRGYTTVKVHEEEFPHESGYFPANQYRIWIELSPVQQRHIEIAVVRYDQMAARQLTRTALGEIDRRIRGRIRRVGRGIARLFRR